MASSCLVILPIHLFDINTLNHSLDSLELLKSSTLKDIYIIEEPVYFGDRDVKLNFNKLKLIYHRASMKYYFDYLQENKNTSKHISKNISKNSSIMNAKLTYINYDELKKKSTPFYKTLLKEHSKIYMFDPVDTYLESKYSKKNYFGNKLEYIESPLFLCTNKDLEDFHKSKPNPNSYTHASFYKWQRSRLHILEKDKTYDTENRNKMPLDTKIPPLPKNDSGSSNPNHNYLVEAIEYVEKQFPNNLEPLYVSAQKKITPESIHFPMTHKSSILWLEHFCKNRLEKFGEFEDSIDSIPRNFLFHSTISPMINIGLITPEQVIEIVSNYYEKHKKISASIGISTYEGFIRQVIGWREYQRYIYKYIGDKMRESNHFKNNRKLSQEWYKATTGIKPIDDAIMLAMNDGYIHHILRLMVVGNVMNLIGIHPDEVYKWFMEFSMDSYDWVMIGNVYSMTLWADGGLTMRKPYISGDGYIMKMGNYSSTKIKTKKKSQTNTTNATTATTESDWNSIWNTIFHHFIDRNQEQLSKTYYNGIVKAWNKKTEKAKEEELTLARNYINKISTT
jgi:deoxyribodipyrimidine photolyase-related protein